MPTIEKRIHQSGKITYRAKVRVKGYPPQEATFDGKIAAHRWSQRTEADLREDRNFPGVKSRKHSVSELIDAYLADLKASNRRRHDEVLPMLVWWKAEIGLTMLSHFDTGAVVKAQQCLLQRERQRKNQHGIKQLLSPATVNRYMVALNTAMQFGVHPLKWLTTNPIAKWKKLEEFARIRFLTTHEISDLLAVCKRSQNPYLRAIVLVALSTGARRSEILNMKWADINPEATLITIPKTKNKKVRSSYLAGPARDEVLAMREVRGDKIYLFPSPHDHNRPIDFESAWSHAKKEAKLADFRFHDLRHTCGSHLAMNGASAVEIAEVLGHKTLTMALRYAHLTVTHTASVVAKMNEGMFAHVAG